MQKPLYIINTFVISSIMTVTMSIPTTSNAETTPNTVLSNPCTLVAQPDAGQVLQGGAQPALTAQTAVGSSCQYQSADQSMNILVQSVNPYLDHIIE